MEALNKKSLSIDLKRRSAVSIPHFIQGDTNIITFDIKENDLEADLSNIERVIVNYKRSDNFVVSRQLEFQNNTVEYQLGNEEMKVSGPGEVELKFFDDTNEQRLSTIRMKVNIVKEIGVGLDGKDAPTLVQQLLVNGQYAVEQGDKAQIAADEAIAAKESSLTNWLSPVADYTAVETIASPNLGDTVQTNDNGYVYRYDGSGWVNTQQYAGTALANVNAQLAEKASKSEVDSKVAQIVSGAPKGVYQTLTELQTARPSGDTGVFIVRSDNKWYYWSGSVWVVGGIYESTTYNKQELYTLMDFPDPNSDLETITLTNQISSNQNAWAPITANISTSGSVTTMTATASGGQITKSISLITGHKYWVKGDIKANSDKAYLYVSSTVGVYHSGSGQVEPLSTVISAVSGSTTIRVRDYSETGWQPIEVSKLMIVDLTAVYGAGNEPTDLEMKDLINYNYGSLYFDGTKTLTVPPKGGAENQVLSLTDSGMKWVNQKDIVKTPLTGKKIVRFGDSITESDPTTIIPDRTGAEVINVGFGGCRMVYHSDPAYNVFSMTRLADAINSGDWSNQIANQVTTPTDDNTVNVQKLVNMDWNTVDVITIAYGTNDFTGLVEPGTVADTTDQTMAGAVNYIVDKISSIYPHIHIVFVTPMFRARQATGDGKDSDTVPNTRGVYLIELVDAIKGSASKNHLPVLDLYRNSGINQYTATIYLAEGDLLHPNVKGWEHIGSKLASFLISNF